MGMLPSQFKALERALRTELSAIQKSIQEHTAATKQANEAGREEWRRIPGIVSAVIDSKDEAHAESAEQTKSEREKEQQPLIESQDRIAKWTKRACIAAIAYGAVAFWQGCLIKKQTEVTQAANTLAQTALQQARDQFAYLQSARLFTTALFQPGELDRQVGIALPPSPMQPSPFVSIQVENIGNGDASEVKYQFQIAEREIGTERLIDAISGEEKIEVARALIPWSRGSAMDGTSAYFSSYRDQQRIPITLSEPNALKLQKTQAFLEIKGTLTYFDGFKMHTDSPFCYRMVGFAPTPPEAPYGDFSTVECVNFSIVYRSVLTQRKSEIADYEKSQQRKQ
jgi:hypothetical protein